MCKKCTKAIKKAIKNGIPEQTAIAWLWENTPFPVGEPSQEQYNQLTNLLRV